jgi:hypothetical protein
VIAIILMKRRRMMTAEGDSLYATNRVAQAGRPECHTVENDMRDR